MYSLYRKGIKDWLNDPKRQKGCCREQIEYLRELNQCDKELARVATLTYFMTTRLKIDYGRSMMNSAIKQRALIRRIYIDLKKYRVDTQWFKAFNADIKGFQRRCEHVYKICQEDIRLTKHWPYFFSIGFDRLLDFQTAYSEEDKTPIDRMIPEMEAWEADHQEEITEYMQSIREELETLKKHKAEVATKEKAEKEAAKAKKKAERDEIREIKKNNEAYRKRQRKIDREFERYYL